MNILALDPALNTGFAYHDGNRMVSGVWNIASACGDTPWLRLTRLRDLILEVNAKLKLDLIAAEDAGFGSRNPHVQAMHNEHRGVIGEVAGELGVPFLYAPPTKFKTWATGHQYASKEQMIAAYHRHYGFLPTSGDEADALWVCRYAIWFHGQVAKGAVVLPKPKGQRKKSKAVQQPLFSKRGR